VACSCLHRADYLKLLLKKLNIAVNDKELNEDAKCSFKGKFHTENLFSINSSKELKKKVIDPMLELYKKV